MAHTSCPSGHSMWNGDGKPVVYAFRINFFKDFVKKYPYFQLGLNFQLERNISSKCNTK